MSAFRRALGRNVLRPLFDRRTLRAVGSAILFVPAYVFFQDNVAQVMLVRGPSMYPLLNADHGSTTRRDALLVSMWKPSEGLERGSVIAFWSPMHPEKMAVKRVIALEGDEVVTRRPYPLAKEVVPQGHVWVEGDHPESRMTLDSNTYGPVSRSLVTGRVVAALWPRWARVDWRDYGGSARVRRGVTTFNEVLHRG